METDPVHPARPVIFLGDSISDAGRDDDPAGLGHGYVRDVAAMLRPLHPDLPVLNRGVGGERARDIVGRLEADCLRHDPAVVSILVGINDTWRRFDRNDPTSASAFEASYRALLERISSGTRARVVVCEPFLLEVEPVHAEYRRDLDEKIAVIRALAREYRAELVPLDRWMHRHAAIVGARAVAADGIHPTAYGHAVVADAWRRAVPELFDGGGPVRWTLSGFGDEIDDDPDMQAAVLSALGASAIEVRSAWGRNIVTLETAELDRLAGILRARGLTVSAVASPVGKSKLDLGPDYEEGRLRAAIAAAHRLGTERIRIFSFHPTDPRAPDADFDDVVARMSAWARIAEAEGVTLLHENEKHIFGDVPERILRLVAAIDSPRLRLAWDSANFVQVGVRPDEDVLALLSPWIDYLHVKDARLSDGAVTPAAQGDGNVGAVVKWLRACGYRGVASLEPHLSAAFDSGGYSGPAAFGIAARAFANLANTQGIELQ
jgi:sugar phosphate isomerase/epimerase/lysophospholipase L1-like esterase